MSVNGKEVNVSSDGFSLKMVSDGMSQTLGIQNTVNNFDDIYAFYPKDSISITLFQGFGLMHLLANSLPEKCTVDFPLFPGILEIIRKMYGAYKEHAPNIITTATREIAKEDLKTGKSYNVSSEKAVVAFSGGKDSLWNLWRMNKLLGKENVLSVHIGGINRSVSAQEEIDTLHQYNNLEDFHKLRIIKLKNSSTVSGKSVMRSRDMFITSLITPLALDFGASRIIIEGDMGTEKDENFQFTEMLTSWELYNNVIQNEIGIPVQVEWADKNDIACVGDLVKNWPEAVSMISNCFSPIFTRKSIRQKWVEQTPNFMLENPSQCGSCIKCRVVRLAMALNNKKYPADEVMYFLLDTKRWVKTKEKKLSDMLGKEFYTFLDSAIEMWRYIKLEE